MTQERMAHHRMLRDFRVDEIVRATDQLVESVYRTAPDVPLSIHQRMELRMQIWRLKEIVDVRAGMADAAE